MILKLLECSDYDCEYGIIKIGNKKITREDVQNKIYDFKNSYKAYGYSSLKEIREDGYKTVEEMMINEDTNWDIDQLIESFPKSWKVSLFEVDGEVEC